MSWYPENPSLAQLLQSGVPDLSVDKGFIAHYQVAAADATAASATACHAAVALAAAAQDVTTNISNPRTPRGVTVKGNAAGIAGDVVITGTNYLDEVITETIALNGATEALGAKAFKTVTKIALPAETHAGTDTVSAGFSDKLGLPFKCPCNTVLFAALNNTREGTAPTVTASATAIDGNTVDLNSALAGTVVDIYLVV